MRWNPIESEDAAFRWLIVIVLVAVAVIAVALLIRAVS